jgi:hypothetical protein
MATTNKILLKKSSVSGKQPAANDIDFGELAINFADGRLYFRDSNDEIQFFEKVGGSTEENLNALLTDLDLGSVTDSNITNLLNLGSVTGTIQGTFDLGFVVTAGIIAPDLFVLPAFTVATLPVGQEAQVVYISDDSGGPTLAFFDGSNWRRTSDNQVVSS